MSTSSTIRPPPPPRWIPSATGCLAESANEPASAASLAGRIGLTRQKVNYHLHALEQHKLVRRRRRTAMGRPHRAPSGRQRDALSGLS